MTGNDPQTSPLVNCPYCQKAIAWTSENPFRPFCSERCKLIDFGAWANEEHKIPSNMPINADELFDQE